MQAIWALKARTYAGAINELVFWLFTKVTEIIMSVWLSLNLMAIALSIVSYCRLNKLRAQGKVAQPYLQGIWAIFLPPYWLTRYYGWHT